MKYSYVEHFSRICNVQHTDTVHIVGLYDTQEESMLLQWCDTTRQTICRYTYPAPLLIRSDNSSRALLYMHYDKNDRKYYHWLMEEGVDILRNHPWGFVLRFSQYDDVLLKHLSRYAAWWKITQWGENIVTISNEQYAPHALGNINAITGTEFSLCTMYATNQASRYNSPNTLDLSTIKEQDPFRHRKIGKIGEMLFAKTMQCYACSLFVDGTYRSGGDGGIDFTLPNGKTVDVKAVGSYKRQYTNGLIKKELDGRDMPLEANIYAFVDISVYDNASQYAHGRVMGFITREEVIQTMRIVPGRAPGHPYKNYCVPYEKLHPICEILAV